MARSPAPKAKAAILRWPVRAKGGTRTLPGPRGINNDRAALLRFRWVRVSAGIWVAWQGFTTGRGSGRAVPAVGLPFPHLAWVDFGRAFLPFFDSSTATFFTPNSESIVATTSTCAPPIFVCAWPKGEGDTLAAAL